MLSHLRAGPHPRSPRAGRTAAALLALALLWPAPASAARRMFSSGSLIIPSSIEYQSDGGILSTYGLVYVTLWKNASRVAAGLKPITFYWAVEPMKLSQYRCNTMTSTLPSYGPSYNDNDGCDFAVQSASGLPVELVDAPGAAFDVSNITYAPATGPTRASTTHSIGTSTTVVKYLGGVWIVDATDRQAFLDMLATTPELAIFHSAGATSSSYVNIHAARANFVAPVASYLSTKPAAIAVVGSNQYSFLMNVLANAGICTASTITTCAGVYGTTPATWGDVYDYYANPADLLDNAPGYPNGRINGTVNNRSYGIVWAGDQAWSGNIPSTQEAHLASFLDLKGNTFFAEYDSIPNVENVASFQTTGGVTAVSAASQVATYEDCTDSATPNAITFYAGSGGDCLVYGGANQPFAQTGNFLYSGGAGSYKGYTANAGFKTGVTQVLAVHNSADNPTVASAFYKENDPNRGLILYLAGHKFDNPPRFWGERVILNSVFMRLNPLAGVELSRSEPVAYKNTSVSPVTKRVYQGTYVQQPLPDSNDVVTYNPAAPQFWQFPFTSGHLRQYTLANISTTAQGFASNSDWDASARLAAGSPGDRTLFTVVGGSGNLGWKRISFDHTETGSSCTDTDGNGKCDLSELLAACNAAGITSSALQNKSVAGAQANTLGMLVQQVRGFCSAHTPKITGTPNFTPSALSDCDNGTLQNNQAKIGGIDHASPAVVGPSRYITDTSPPLGTRPIVAYAAGLDGMLHAFYVSGSDGTTSATWTAEGKSLPSGVQPGQELWAFVPPGQVCGLAFNNALVDGSVNVVDAFADFPYDANGDGVIDWTDSTERPNHVRRWRTILTASAGLGGSELFALDVTNPLNPVLLWHVGGQTEHDGRFDVDGDGVFGAGEVFDKTDPPTYAIKWFDWDDGLSTTAHIPTDYNTTNSTVIDAIKFGRYDYRNLGQSYSNAVAKIWSGGAYQYILYVTTNAADYTNATAPTGYRGAETFAIDLVTGQKLWQWEHLYYSGDGSGVDNSIPPRMALGDIDANGSTDRIYVGDLEGRLWELSALDGRNLNYLAGSDGKDHSFPVFGAPAMTGAGGAGANAATVALFKVDGATPLSQQPLTTPIGQGRFTSVPSGLGSALLNRLTVVLGTMGVDWAIAPYERGHLFVIPVAPDMGTRLTAPVDLSASRDPLKYGLLLPTAAWDIPLAVGERVYDMPRVVNNTIVFNTAFGSFAGDITATVTDPGNFKVVTGDSTGSHVTTTANDAKAFGGVLVVDGAVVITTDQKIRQLATPPASLAGGSAPQRPFNRVTPAIVKSWQVVPQ